MLDETAAADPGVRLSLGEKLVQLERAEIGSFKIDQCTEGLDILDDHSLSDGEERQRGAGQFWDHAGPGKTGWRGFADRPSPPNGSAEGSAAFCLNEASLEFGVVEA